MSIDPEFAAYVETSLQLGIAETQKLDDAKLVALQDDRQEIWLRAVRYGVNLYPLLASKLLLALFPFFERHGTFETGIEVYESSLATASFPTEIHAKLLDRLGVLHRMAGAPNKAISQHTHALDLTTNSQLKVRYYIHLALACFQIHDYQTAQRHANSATKLLTRREGQDWGSLQNVNGMLALHTGRFQEAITYFQNAIIVWEQIKDDSNHAITLNNLGLTFEKLGRIVDALQQYDQALAILIKTVNVSEQVRVLIHKGGLYGRLGQFELALQTFQKADTSAFRRLSNLFLQAQLDTNLGLTLIELLRPDEAIVQLDDALEKWMQLEDKLNYANALGERGRAYAQAGMIESGCSELKEAIRQLEAFSNELWAGQLLKEFTQELEKLC